MLIKCPECGHDVSDLAPSCPHCGYVLAAASAASSADPITAVLVPPKKGKAPTPVALAISVVALLMALASPRFTVAMPLIISAASAIIALVRKERWRWSAIVVLVLCLVMFFWAADLGSSVGMAGKDVTYSVTGSASSADITYENEGGGTSQEKVTLPWTQVVHSPTNRFLYVSAQNQGEYGDITCEIKVGDEVVKTSTSSGAYTIASCSQ